MKSAILLYGQLRRFNISDLTFKECISTLNKNYDIFCHFGYQENDDIESFIKEYNPKILKIEKDPTINEIVEHYNLNKNIFVNNRLLIQLFSMEKVFNILKEYEIKENIKYDLYIKTRTDLVFKNKIDLNIDNLSAYVCRNIWGQDINDYTTDLLLLTKSFQNIKKICNMGYYIDNIINSFNNEKYYHHEEILAQYLKIEKIQIKSHNVKVTLARDFKC
jgi:hypothetical protein